MPQNDEKKLTNDDVQRAIGNPITEVFGKLGITPEYLARKLKRELNAKETKVFNPKGNDSEEGLLYSKPLIAWSIRQRAREDAQKLLGLYPAEKHELNIPGVLTIDQISPERRERAKRAAEIAAKIAVEEAEGMQTYPESKKSQRDASQSVARGNFTEGSGDSGA